MRVRIRQHGDVFIASIRDDDGRMVHKSAHLPSLDAAAKWAAEEHYNLRMEEAENLRSLDNSLMWRGLEEPADG